MKCHRAAAAAAGACLLLGAVMKPIMQYGIYISEWEYQEHDQPLR